MRSFAYTIACTTLPAIRLYVKFIFFIAAISDWLHLWRRSRELKVLIGASRSAPLRLQPFPESSPLTLIGSMSCSMLLRNWGER